VAKQGEATMADAAVPWNTHRKGAPMTEMKRARVTEDEMRGLVEKLLWNLSSEVADLRKAIEQQHVVELVRIGDNLVMDRRAQLKWLYSVDERTLRGWSFCSTNAVPAVTLEGDAAEWFWGWLTNYGQ